MKSSPENDMSIIEAFSLGISALSAMSRAANEKGDGVSASRFATAAKMMEVELSEVKDKVNRGVLFGPQLRKLVREQFSVPCERKSSIDNLELATSIGVNSDIADKRGN